MWSITSTMLESSGTRLPYRTFRGINQGFLGVLFGNPLGPRGCIKPILLRHTRSGLPHTSLYLVGGQPTRVAGVTST